MANQLAKDLEIMFENYVEGFEAACVVSRNAKKFRPGDTAMQRAGDVLYRPQHYHMNIEEGLDLSSKTPTALVQRLVPSVFKEPKNILYTLKCVIRNIKLKLVAPQVCALLHRLTLT